MFLARCCADSSYNINSILKVDDGLGSLDQGKYADIVVLQEDFSVMYTIVGGEIVYQGKFRRVKCSISQVICCGEAGSGDHENRQALGKAGTRSREMRNSLRNGFN